LRLNCDLRLRNANAAGAF